MSKIMPIFQKEARITNELETLDLVLYVIFVEIVSRLNVTLENMYKKTPPIVCSKFEISTIQTYFTKSKTLTNEK